jgi:Lon protease-like protein
LDDVERVSSALRRLKLFPLPQAVLFPGALLPLHIFEPRYRQMVDEALDSDSVFAMARPLRGVSGEPTPLEQMVCAGVITTHEKLEDGRYNLVIQGVMRARIVQELPNRKLYREVEAQGLPDAPYQGGLVTHVRQAVLALAPLLPEAAAELVHQVASAKDGGELADLVATAVVNDEKRRGRLLDETRVPERLELVLEDISGLLARLGAQAGGTGGLKN